MRKTIYKACTTNLSCRTVTAHPGFLVKCHGQGRLFHWRTYFKQSKHFYTGWQIDVNGWCSHSVQQKFVHVTFAEIKVEDMKQFYHVGKSVVSTNACYELEKQANKT